MDCSQLPEAALKNTDVAKNPAGFFHHAARFGSTRVIFDSLTEMKLLESPSVPHGVMLYSREQLELWEGFFCQKMRNSFS